MTLRECMEAHTNREYLTWQEWLDEQWNSPTLSDMYAMQTAAEVRRSQSSKPRQVKLEHFRLKFRPRKPTKPTMTKEQATAASKARWFGFLGIKRDG